MTTAPDAQHAGVPVVKTVMPGPTQNPVYRPVLRGYATHIALPLSEDAQQARWDLVGDIIWQVVQAQHAGDPTPLSNAQGATDAVLAALGIGGDS